jgi:tripartite-type tricarboxylate transporter receptor subunit TctC
MSKSITALLALAGAILTGAVEAQGYPSKPVHLVVPYSAGGGADTLARALAQRLSETWGQQVLVENRPGANTAIGAVYVAKSTPDGYTLLMIETALVINPSLYTKLPYDPFRDFAPVTGLVGISQALVVNPAVPAKNLKELIQLAKTKPGEMSYASFGLGSTGHLNMEMLQQMAGIKLNHIQYKGTAPAMVDLTGGHVNMMFSSTGGVLPHWKSGRVRLLAIGSKARLPQFADIPTVAEAGLTGYEANAWFGLVAPAATPREVIGRINAGVQKVFAEQTFREKNLVPQAFESIVGSPEQFGDYMRAEAQKWGRVARESKVKLD